MSTTMTTTRTTNITRTIPERLNDHEVRLRTLESGAIAPTKPWWLSKGVMGPLASGVATVALCVGYIEAGPPMRWRSSQRSPVVAVSPASSAD